MKRTCAYEQSHEFDDINGFTHIHVVTTRENIHYYLCPFHWQITGNESK
jgi:hypothetical protein